MMLVGRIIKANSSVFCKILVSCFCILCAEVLLHVNVNLLRIENFENCGDDEEEVERMLNTSIGFS